LAVGHTGEPCQMAESIEMPFGGRRVWAHGATIGYGAHWHHLANTIDRLLRRRQCVTLATCIELLSHRCHKKTINARRNKMLYPVLNIDVDKHNVIVLLIKYEEDAVLTCNQKLT